MNKNENIYVINCIGKDLVGLVGLITSVIYGLNCNIIDIQQSVMHGYFSMLVIIDTKTIKTDIKDLSNKIFEVGNQTGLKIIFEKFQEGRRKTDKKIMSMIIIGEDKPGIVSSTTIELGNYGINIENIRMIARGELFMMELLCDVSEVLDTNEIIQKNIKNILNKMNVGVHFKTENIYNQSKKLIVFDINSSLIEKNILDMVNKNINLKKCLENCNKKNNIKDIKNRAELLKGINIETINQITEKLKLTPDGEEIIRDFKSFGYKIALISSGFKMFTDKFKEILKLDYTFGNILLTDNEGKKLTGKIEEPVIDVKKKKDIINFLCQSENISPQDVFFIGDFSTDDIILKSHGIFVNLEEDFFKLINDKINDKTITNENIAGILCALGLSDF